jgi:hypothetical protein
MHARIEQSVGRWIRRAEDGAKDVGELVGRGEAI